MLSNYLWCLVRRNVSTKLQGVTFQKFSVVTMNLMIKSRKSHVGCHSNVLLLITSYTRVLYFLVTLFHEDIKEISVSTVTRNKFSKQTLVL